ncbi:hypothetical protein C8R43DRAFT_1137777 [Mycena crocata]|nr:hypothetical protein C8R43DRAFT_1137777 [Mycena crocata]
MHLKLSNLGKCNNGNCISGCGLFASADAIDLDALIERLTKCLICGCFAAQHVLKAAESSSATTAAPLAEPAAAAVPPMQKTSATATTLKGSRPPPFRARAEDRQKDINAALPSGNKFHPAKQSQVEGDLNPYGSASNHRNRHPPKNGTDQKPSRESKAAPAPPPPKKVAGTAYTAVLVEDTKAVDAGTYLKPPATKLNDLADEGYMKKIFIADAATPAEIDESFQTAYSKVTQVVEYGYQLLRVFAPFDEKGGIKKGVPQRLMAFRDTTISVDMLQRAVANTKVREGGRNGFKNLVYLALARGSPNLPLQPPFLPVVANDGDESGSESETVSDYKPATKKPMASDTKPSPKRPTRNSSFPGYNGVPIPEYKRGKRVDESSDTSEDEGSESQKRPRKKQKPSPASNDGSDHHTFSDRQRDQNRANGSEDVRMSSDEHREGNVPGDETASMPQGQQGKYKTPDQGDDENYNGSKNDRKGKGKARDEGDDEDHEAPKHERKGKGKAQDGTESYRFRFYDDQAGPPVSSEHLQLRRLLKNMSKPAKPFSSWWLEKIPDQYKLLERFSLMLPDWLELVTDGAIPVTKFYSYFRDRFLIHVDDLLELGSNLPRPGAPPRSTECEQEFDSLFFIGPGGLSFLVQLLDETHEAIKSTHHLVQGDEECLAAIAEVHSASRSLLFSLQYFRTKHPRSLWDPSACRDLAAFLLKSDSKLPVGVCENRMVVILRQINLHDDSATRIISQLTMAFGDIRDPKHMVKDILVGGPDGLLYFYTEIVGRILDDVEHTEYGAILEAICMCCAGITRKATSFIKSPGNTSQADTPDDGASQFTGAGGRQQSASAHASDGHQDGRRTRSGAGGSMGGSWQKNAKTGKFRFKDPLDLDSADDLMDVSDDSQKPPPPKTAETKHKRVPSPIFLVSTDESDDDLAKPKTNHTPKPKPKQTDSGQREENPKPEAKAPPPKPQAPPSAGPSGTNFETGSKSTRPKPRPSYRGTAGYEDWTKYWNYPPRTPPSAPPPRPRPPPVQRPSQKPKARPPPGVERDLYDIEEMHSMGWVKLVPHILTSFPHPVHSSVWNYARLSALNTRLQFQRLTLIYHPDHNGTRNEDWRRVTAAITQVLISKRPYYYLRPGYRPP